ncbi:MAG: hypothetical protein AB7O98_05895 [Hyphomonadaceae bacterium]
MFLLFYLVANYVLLFLLRDVWQLTWADAPSYAIYFTSGLVVSLAVGVPIVALFKWLKTRRTGRDKRLDAEIAQIRAELSAKK